MTTLHAIYDGNGVIGEIIEITSTARLQERADAAYNEAVAAAEAARTKFMAEMPYTPPAGYTLVEIPDGEIWKTGGTYINDTYAAPALTDIEKTRLVNAHALVLKIGVVNATKTDGGPDYPYTSDALAMIRETYTDYLNEVSAKSVMGEAVSDAEKSTVGLIRAGFAFHKAVDAAAQTILAAGDASEPIAADARWPAIPSGD